MKMTLIDKAGIEKEIDTDVFTTEGKKITLQSLEGRYLDFCKDMQYVKNEHHWAKWASSKVNTYVPKIAREIAEAYREVA